LKQVWLSTGLNLRHEAELALPGSSRIIGFKDGTSDIRNRTSGNVSQICLRRRKIKLGVHNWRFRAAKLRVDADALT
jgi:hypothetical protein